LAGGFHKPIRQPFMSHPIKREGVIQYHRKVHPLGRPPVDYDCLADCLIRWRATLKAMNWVGQCNQRYDGLGYGNISLRIGQRTSLRGSRQFLITGSQTGELDALTTTDLAWVTGYSITDNRIEHAPLATPSSESLTHAAVYDGNAALRACMHIHCPIIWNQRHRLDHPRIPSSVGYGTIEMAERVRSICGLLDPESPRLIIMDGHRDGVICASKTPGDAFMTLVRAYQTSIA
jgi:L-ribulose-5-phosphate 4-epimerase